MTVSVARFLREEHQLLVGELEAERVKTFRAGEKFRPVRTEARKMTFLYADGTDAHFMDSESYEQLAVPEGSVANALKDELNQRFASAGVEVLDAKLEALLTYGQMPDGDPVVNVAEQDELVGRAAFVGEDQFARPGWSVRVHGPALLILGCLAGAHAALGGLGRGGALERDAFTRREVRQRLVRQRGPDLRVPVPEIFFDEWRRRVLRVFADGAGGDELLLQQQADLAAAGIGRIGLVDAPAVLGALDRAVDDGDDFAR